MKKILILIILTGITLFFACEPDQPAAPQLNLTLNQLALSKIVMVGNSFTAGFQSAGMLEEFQINSYPYLLAQQVGLLTGQMEFEQPLVEEPGIGTPAGMTPMYLDSEGNIAQDTIPNFFPPVYPRLLNLELTRPYDNLGVPGADLNDLLNTTESATNPWFTMILRNPNMGNTTQLQQVAMLFPTMVLLWAGSNDVLGAALDGGDLDQITSQDDFQNLMTQILTQLRTDLGSKPIIMANIPYVTDIPYINTLDPVFLAGTPMVFDTNLQPIDFGGGTGLYLPLITNESNVEHITLVGLGAYQQGLGIPDSAYMVDNLGLGQGQAKQLEDGMIAAGLTPTGLALDGTMTLTSSEASTIKTAIDGFNATISALANTFVVPVVNANAALTELNVNGIDGATGKFVMVDPANTAFSLDGVHPNNAGNAIIVNEFLKVINAVLQLDTPIPEVDVSSKLGQYLPTPGKMDLGKSISNVRQIFKRRTLD
jgi:lysophospholipase L1-like esterase